MSFLKIILPLALTTNMALAVDTTKNVINGVAVESIKKDDARTYVGTISKDFSTSIENVVKSVVNFNEKCNNSLKDRREFTDKKANCKYHNENLVETVMIKNINKAGWTKEVNEVDRYLLARHIYNRGKFHHYELIRMYEKLNSKNQKTIIITQTMLDDKEVKKYTNPKFDKDSAFDQVISTFTITEVAPNQTNLNYQYKAVTDHWMLNKEVSVPQVFASMSKGINDLIKAMDQEARTPLRDVAAN